MNLGGGAEVPLRDAHPWRKGPIKKTPNLLHAGPCTASQPLVLAKLQRELWQYPVVFDACARMSAVRGGIVLLAECTAIR